MRYIDSLDKAARCRYEAKLVAVKNIDPYQNLIWTDDPKYLPPVEQDDISDYLVHRTSFYTRKKFKAYKQLGAHNQHTSGWVKTIYTHKPRDCENIIATAEVSHIHVVLISYWLVLCSSRSNIHQFHANLAKMKWVSEWAIDTGKQKLRNRDTILDYHFIGLCFVSSNFIQNDCEWKMGDEQEDRP